MNINTNEQYHKNTSNNHLLAKSVLESNGEYNRTTLGTKHYTENASSIITDSSPHSEARFSPADLRQFNVNLAPRITFNLTSDAAVVDYVTNMLQTDFQLMTGKPHRAEHSIIIRQIVLNFIRFSFNSMRTVWQRYHRSKDAYTKLKQHGNDFVPSYRYLIEIMNWLESSGYIESIKGFNDRKGGEGHLTRVRPTQELLNLILLWWNYECSQVKVNLPSIHGQSTFKILTDHAPFADEKLRQCASKSDLALRDIYYVKNPIDVSFNRSQRSNPIILKDNDKKIISYTETTNTRKMSDFIFRYNSVLADSCIDILEVRLPTQGLRRVFNNCEWDAGGRFYGGEWQRFSSTARSTCLINSEHTVELDYGSFHLRMCYHIMDIDVEGDPYDLSSQGFGPEFRELIKSACLILINAKKGGAVRALNEEIKRNDQFTQFNVSGKELMEAVGRKHYRIKSLFSVGSGIRLQYFDSQIAEEVMSHFLEKSVLVLPVHDSFICQKQYKDELKETMENAYLKRFSYLPVVK